jgi:hypothetical protein
MPGAGRRPKSRRADLALLAATLLLCVVASEAVLRVVQPPEPVFVREDPDLGFANIPEARGLWRRETEEPVLVEINSRRLRDVERPVAKPAGATRVLMLGDSFVAAFNTPFEEIASRRLQALLREALGTAAVDVVNAGTQGWGTSEELLYLRLEGFAYAPDAVVLNFYLGNDFLNNHVRTSAPTKPSFSLEDGELRFHAPLRREGVVWLRDNVLAKSALARALRRSPLPQLLGLHGAMVQAGLVSGEGNPSLDDETARELVEVSCRLVETMAREVAGRGAEFLVHVIPAPQDLVPFLPPELRPESRSNEVATHRRDLLREGLLGCLGAAGVPHVFPWEGLVEESRAGRLLFVDGIGHWTSHGNQRAAADVAAALLPALRRRAAAEGGARPGAADAAPRAAAQGAQRGAAQGAQRGAARPTSSR